MPRLLTHPLMRPALALLVLASGGVSQAALAAAGAATGTGTAQARVLQPVSMANTAEMRFGQIIQPVTAGTVTLSPGGTVTAAGGAAGNQTIAQTGGGPAAGEFTITMAPNTAFSVYGPLSFTLTNGTSTMSVSVLTGSLQTVSQTATAITYRLRVGGTLSLAANQAVGTYTGSYTLQTVYQ